MDRRSEIGDDDLAEGAVAVGLTADRIMAVGEPLMEVLMVVFAEHRGENVGGKGFCDRRGMATERR